MRRGGTTDKFGRRMLNMAGGKEEIDGRSERDTRIVGLGEEDAEDRARWRRMIHYGDS